VLERRGLIERILAAPTPAARDKLIATMDLPRYD
jgi:hypothetical protein